VVTTRAQIENARLRARVLGQVLQALDGLVVSEDIERTRGATVLTGLILANGEEAGEVEVVEISVKLTPWEC